MEQQTGSKIGKGVRQGFILSPCLFNLHAEYIMQNAGLDEVQAGIKIAGRNINNLRYADDTTFMAESEELKTLLKVESEKVGIRGQQRVVNKKFINKQEWSERSFRQNYG